MQLHVGYLTMENNQYSPIWAHSEITEIFPDIFYVMGTNITKHNDIEFQHSRNMIIIRDNGKLSLINTVRLNEKGLSALDALGKVENIIRIGAFHGRDDAFYLDRYHAKLWALEGMQHQNNRLADILLISNGTMPFTGCSLFMFETSVHPEGILHIAKEGGILITCDSIKNWVAPDPFFSADSAKLYKEQGFFGIATISNVWKQACKVQSSDFLRLKALKFKHLLSAHGEPLVNNAYEAVTKTIQKEYGV
jgi:hypothetical protein